ncbi:MAG: protein O-mannosyl-transferase family, partial [bacterium]
LVFKNLGIKNYAAVISCLVLAFSRTLWSHAGAARVYALTGFFFVILLIFLTKWFQNRKLKYLYLFAFFLGFGFGAHITIGFAAIMLLVVLLITDRRILINLKFLSKSAILFLMPFIQYLYLFVAYNRFKIINFGDLSNFAGFFHYITQRDFAYKIATQSLDVVYAIFNTAFKLALNEFTWVLFLAIIGGAVIFYKFYKEKRPLFWGFVSVVFANLLLMINYGNLNDLVILFRYFLLSYIVVSIFIAFSLQFIFYFIKNICRAPQIIAVLLLLVIPIIPLKANYSLNNRHNNYIVQDFAENILKTVEGSSLIISSGDAVTGSLWYLQSIGERNDVVIVDKDLLVANWYVKNQGKVYPEVFNLSLLQLNPLDRFTYLIGTHSGKRPIYTTFLPTGLMDGFNKFIASPEGTINPFIFVPRGITYKIIKGQDIDINFVHLSNNELWSKYQLRGVAPNQDYDFLITFLVNSYSVSLNNLGAFYWGYKLLDEAKSAFEKSLEIDPDNSKARDNLNRLFNE